MKRILLFSFFLLFLKKVCLRLCKRSSVNWFSWCVSLDRCIKLVWIWVWFNLLFFFFLRRWCYDPTFILTFNLLTTTSFHLFLFHLTTGIQVVSSYLLFSFFKLLVSINQTTFLQSVLSRRNLLRLRQLILADSLNLSGWLLLLVLSRYWVIQASLVALSTLHFIYYLNWALFSHWS